ncbi:MAG: hypothetical protein SF052_17355 [Bacteroidia bacterium]|nr:hypothetical protein [Bacteroidia bacterium]
MQYFTFCVVTFLMIFTQSCDRSIEKKTSETPQAISPDVANSPQAGARLQPSVPDPAQQQQMAPKLLEVKPAETGLDFAMSLPEDYAITSTEDRAGKLIYAQNGAFQLVVKETNESIDQMRNYWEEGYKGAKFSRWIISGENGLLVEMEKNGKAEFYVDYLYKGTVRYRLTTPVDKSFSQNQAIQMFHACRMLEVVNKEGKGQ